MVIRNHPLRHLPELKVSGEVLDCRFERTCSTSNCRGDCCRQGVDVDLAERDRILEYADRIVGLMDLAQQQDPRQWFGEPFEDSDFPSGKAASTRLRHGACTFLDDQGLCVLQKAECGIPSATENLKPFFCRAYPLTLDNGTLTVDTNQCAGETRCCRAVDGGEMTIFEVCEFELEHVLGAKGLDELRAMRPGAGG